MQKLKHIGAAMPEKLTRKLQRLCKKENRNKSEMLRELIRRAK